MDGYIEVTGIISRPENNADSKYKVWLTYLKQNTGTSLVGKVLYANLKDDTDVKMFDFTDTLTIFWGNSINRKMINLLQVSDHYQYGGYMNYYPDFQDFENYDIDWTKSGKTYGFLTTYSSSDHCQQDVSSEVKINAFGT